MVKKRSLNETKPKDFLDPYLPFTSYVLAIALISALRAPNIDLKALTLGIIALSLGLYGSHYADMVKGDYRTTPKKLETTITGLMLGGAAILGVFLAIITTTWFLILVFFGAFLAIAYNLELFEGKLHNPDESGYPIFGTAWGFIPSLGMSIIMGNLTASTFVMAVGFGILVVPFLMMFEASKPEKKKKNPLIDNPHNGLENTESKKVTYKALLLFAPALWTFVFSGILSYLGQ